MAGGGRPARHPCHRVRVQLAQRLLWRGRATLAAAGLAVYAVDLRGRGKSDGERFYVESFADCSSDVGGLVALTTAAHPGLPVYPLGHSAGGVVACIYTLDHGAQLAGLICESFAFQVPAPDFAIAAFKGLSHLAQHAHVLKLANKDFSRDPAAVAAMDADPLIAHETQPTQTVAQMARADDRLKTSFGSITLPVLILHGTADHATRPAGSQFFYYHAGSGDKTLKLYDGHFHDCSTISASKKCWPTSPAGSTPAYADHQCGAARRRPASHSPHTAKRGPASRSRSLPFFSPPSPSGPPSLSSPVYCRRSRATSASRLKPAVFSSPPMPSAWRSAARRCRWPRLDFPAGFALLLLAAFTIGQVGCALAPNYPAMLVARVRGHAIHGAIFGVGAILATHLVSAEKAAGKCLTFWQG